MTRVDSNPSPVTFLRFGADVFYIGPHVQAHRGDNPNFLCTLAAAYAAAGRFPEAVETAQRALQLAGAQYNTALADDIRSELKLYQSGAPFHLSEPTPPK